MAIAASDIKIRLSTQSGAAGNTNTSTPADSLGKFIATTDLTDNSLDNLFRDITAAESAAGVTIYRCFFVYNSHGSLTYQNAKIWIASQQAGGGDMTMGLDPAGVVAVGLGSAQAAAPADETTAPAGVTFSNPNSEGAALSIGNMANGTCQAVWVKLVVSAGASAVADQAVVTVKGDTDP